jgi:hypothetical protein
MTLKILDGFDERQIPRFSDEMKKSKPDVQLDENSLAHETQIHRRQDEWLKRQGLQ